MLEKALDNIENHFSFVGTVEKFDESLIILKKMYGWRTPFYGVINKTSNRPRVSEIDKETLEIVTYYNAADIKLYDEVSKKLKAKITDEVNMNRQLFQLKALSSAYQTQSYLKSGMSKFIPSKYKNAFKKILKN